MMYLISIFVYFAISFCGMVFNPQSLVSWQIAGYILGGLLFIVTLVIQLTSYYLQADAYEEIEQCKEDKKSYEEESTHLVQEFKLYLADKYPQHEKEIFDKLKPENVSTYLARYPEIKANETMVKLCNLINQKVSKIYDKDRRINFLERSIRTRKRTILLTCLPILPKR
jgi:hypothetical protein